MNLNRLFETVRRLEREVAELKKRMAEHAEKFAEPPPGYLDAVSQVTLPPPDIDPQAQVGGLSLRRSRRG